MNKRIRNTVLLAASLALTSPAWATPAPTSATPPHAAASKPAIASPAVKVKGANLIAGTAPQLSLKGGSASEPSFAILAYAVKEHPEWKVTALETEGASPITRMTMTSVDGARLSLDVSSALKSSLQLKDGDQVTATHSRAGRGEMVVFYKGKTPLGLVPNDQVAMPK